MSDVFISYSRVDRPMAEALANDLKARGFRVWWDAELVGSDDFYEVILEALRQAKATIVIWTKASAKSNFVRDEARFALHLKKLIATKEATLGSLEIPFGFQGQHTDDVTNRDNILRAIDKLGVKPATTPDAATSIAEWEKIKTSAGIDGLITFLGNNPPEAQRQAAVARLKELSASPGATRGISPLVRSLTTSSWSAFFSGLTFRMPKFQLSTQGTWASVGMAVAYLMIMFLITGVIFGAGGDAMESSHVPYSLVVSSILTVVLLLLVWVATNRFNNFLSTKSLAAAFGMALAIVVLAIVTPLPMLIALENAVVRTGNNSSNFRNAFAVFGLATMGITFVTSVIYVLRKFRAAR